MDLRRELLPPSGNLRGLTKIIAKAFEIEETDGAYAAVEWLSAEADINMTAEDLHGYAESVDARDVARDLRQPPLHELRKLNATRDELVEIVRRWLRPSSAFERKNEDWWMSLFAANTLRPDATSLDSYRTPEGSWVERTPEEVVDLALAYRPIEL